MIRFNNQRVSLARQLEANARVIDHKTGYVLIAKINHQVEPQILKQAAAITKGLFLDRLPAKMQPQVVVGVPNRGKEFATVLGMVNNLKIGISDRVEIKSNEDKEFSAEYLEEEDMVVIYGIPSFTQPGKFFIHKLRGIRPNNTVLIADDFSATGSVTNFYQRAFTQLKIEPIFVYLVAKDFSDTNPPQRGYRQNKQAGIPVFAVVRLTEMSGGKVKVTAEDI